MDNTSDPPHPGEILRSWLSEISITDAAAALGVTRAHLSRILNCSAGISAEMDVRLSFALGTSVGSWYALQAGYNLSEARRRFRNERARIRRIPLSRRRKPLHLPRP